LEQIWADVPALRFQIPLLRKYFFVGGNVSQHRKSRYKEINMNIEQMTLDIRKAKTTDFEEIHSLIKEFAEFIKTPEKVITTPSQMNNDKGYFNCFIAVDKNKIIGFATYFIAYYSWTGKAIYLDDLYVLEKYRGQGIGNKLLDKVIETAKSENCKKVKWQVSNWNEKAIEFYKIRGATIDEVEINCDLTLHEK
jgi:GNAT superfamily N-acetyltransferase